MKRYLLDTGMMGDFINHRTRLRYPLEAAPVFTSIPNGYNTHKGKFMRRKRGQGISRGTETQALFQPGPPRVLGVASADKVSIPAGPAMRKWKGKRKGKGPGKDAVISPDSITIQSAQGIPDESQVHEAARALPSKDRKTLKKLLNLVAKHLGSRKAARLWLITPFSKLSTTPLDAVQKGDAKLLLKVLESQWGRSPIYT